MPCNAEHYRRINSTAEKIETLSRLSPCLESDEETAYTLSVLMSVIHDYTQQLRHALNTLATASSAEEDDA